MTFLPSRCASSPASSAAGGWWCPKDAPGASHRRPGARGLDEHPRRPSSPARGCSISSPAAARSGSRRSRAAPRTATFVELNPPSLEALRGQHRRRSASASGPRSTAATRCASPRGSTPGAFDVAFADPPYTARRGRPAGRALPPHPVRAHSFGRAPGRPAARRATRPAATATPPSPSATPHDPDRALPGLVRSADEGPRGPGAPEPRAGRPGDRGGRHERRQAAALLAWRSGSACCARRSAATPRVSIQSFDGLLAEFAKRVGAVDHRPRAAGGERLRVRVPDGADEPAAAPVARDGLPGPGAWTSPISAPAWCARSPASAAT